MNTKLQPGDQAVDFCLPATDLIEVRLVDELARYHAIVVLFLCNHCPYVMAYIPRLIQLQQQFSPTDSPGVRFIGICSNDAQTYPQDSFDGMKQSAQQWGLNFPYLHDEDQTVAAAWGAERTPEVFVLNRDGACIYEGGIDDHYQDPSKVTQQPLRDALKAIIEGRSIDRPQTYAIGCTIKWKNG